MKLFDVYPIHEIEIVQGRGSYLWDSRGQRYLDMYGGHAVISIGHSHPHYIQRITEQLNRIGFYSNSVRIPLQEELADTLGRVSGKKSYQLFLCNSGAEANENALKLASFHNGRRKIVAFTKAFHGRTSLAVAVTDNPSIRAAVNSNEHVAFLPYNDVEALESYFKQHGDQVAAVIIEGIQGVGGIHVATDLFLQTIRRLCDQYGTLYIADGIQCGYGRSGLFFSHDHAGVEADIYTMAKGMGNGFPVAGILIAPHIQPKHYLLGTTFGGNHLACAAALAVLEVMENENLMEHARVQGEKLMRVLQRQDGLGQPRGRGLMIGFDVPEPLASLRKQLLYEAHVFTGESKPSVIRLLPSLALSNEDLDLFATALQSVLEKLEVRSPQSQS